jgi:hypothetical protein
MFCTQCGDQLKESQKFCTSCGSPGWVTSPVATSYASVAVPPAKTSTSPSSSALAEAPHTVATSEIPRPVPIAPLKPTEIPLGESSRVTAPRKAVRPFMWGGIAGVAIGVIVAVILFLHWSAQPRVSDNQIEKSIQMQLAVDPNLRRCTIAASSRNGVVRLAGYINADSDRETAVRIAKQLRGVKKVVDFMRFTPTFQIPLGQSQSQLNTPVGTPATASTTMVVPGNQSWTPTGISVDSGVMVKISASGGVSFSAGSKPSGPVGDLPDCLTVANGPYGWRARPFVANQLPCHSLIGRLGERGVPFYIGRETTFRAATTDQLYLGVNDNTLGDNSGKWTAVITVLGGSGAPSSASQITSDQPSNSGARIARALIAQGGTSLELPSGQMYLYGMTTGGGAPSSQFTAGQYADAKNAAGLLSDALAYGTSSQNSYGTQTAYHDIGGVSVTGSWEHFAAYYGANHQSGAHDSSVSFQTDEDSLVVVLGLASSQQFVSVEGIPNLQVDASRTGGGIVIAHANVKRGSYNVVEHSKVLAAGQDPAHMADLVGVFVFGGKQRNEMLATSSVRVSPASASGASNENIRSVDFQNFEYRTNCLSENVAPEMVRVANGQANNQDGQFWAGKQVYGNFKGDGHELAAVALSCHPADMSPNVGFSEVLVFEMSESGPKVLTKLPPSFWKQARVTGLKVSNQQLAADFLEIGMGSNACPEWVVTSKLRWNGTSFVNAGESRKKNSCAR